jgi:hypothetical protein
MPARFRVACISTGSVQVPICRVGRLFSVNNFLTTIDMKNIWIALALLLAAIPSYAQLTSTIVRHPVDPSAPQNRDYWFALPSNQWGQSSSGKSIRIYITSQQNCTAFVALNGTTTPVPVSAYKISSFSVPLPWEMESSGIVENKAIHVYSKTGDVSVSFVSQESSGSDGSYLLPTFAWGTDYSVAAYSPAYNGGVSINDLPSECTIVSDQDSTILIITPSCDCRTCDSGSTSANAQANVVAFPAGQPFSVRLDMGQSLQLMSVFANGPTGYDLTGTMIHASHPVGVIGGRMGAEIPVGFPSPNFICEMIPPISNWAKTYYAANPVQPAGMSGHDFARYLFVASEPGQVIYRTYAADSTRVECVIPKMYGIYWDELERGQKFFSSAPFMVMSYLNSASYPDSVNGEGGPSEFSVLTLPQYATTDVFETPQSVGSIAPYDNDVNILCRDSDAEYTQFDGRGILSLSSQAIDDTFEVFTVPHIATGSHTLVQDLTKDPTAAGVGAYLYGYRSDEAYAWSVVGLGNRVLNSPDTIPPIADTMVHCSHGFVHLSDSGILPDGVTKQSGLSVIQLDSAYNMNYIPDIPPFIEGSGADTSGYGLSVIDPTQPAILFVEVYDRTGNVARITSTYTPLIGSITPPIQNLGIWDSGTPPNIAYDTIFNIGQTTLDLSVIHLRYGNVGFSLSDSIGGPVDRSPLAAGERRLIQIQFQSNVPSCSVDTIIAGNSCDTTSAAVIGSAGAKDFAVTGTQTTFGPMLFRSNSRQNTKTFTIQNITDSILVINTIQVIPANSAFSIRTTVGPQVLPSFMPPGQIWEETVDFNDSLSTAPVQTATVEITSNTCVPTFDTLTGRIGGAVVSDENVPKSPVSVITMQGGSSFEIILPPDRNDPVRFELLNILGESVLRAALHSGSQTVDASALPRGVYFYRLSSGAAMQSGKVILGE